MTDNPVVPKTEDEPGSVHPWIQYGSVENGDRSNYWQRADGIVQIAQGPSSEEFTASFVHRLYERYTDEVIGTYPTLEAAIEAASKASDG